MIDTALVRALLDAQFPQWAGLPLRRMEQAGSDHVIHRLGDELAVRLPRHEGAIDQAEKEYAWLPRLAPHLPLAIPVPVAVGRPAQGYPWPWAISRWLPGEVATVARFGESTETAVQLAGFLTALQNIPLSVPPAAANRRPPAPDRPRTSDLLAAPTLPAATERLLAPDLLAARDVATRAAIGAVASVFDAAALTRVWEAALDAPPWGRPPVWYHGDFHTGNLLAVGGRISTVIDFGGLGAGDPAKDMMMAFTLFGPGSRAAFREALAVDDATWARGRGWALASGLNAYVSYASIDARVAAQTTRQIAQALAG